jgi:CheY-like chemotaxis protein
VYSEHQSEIIAVLLDMTMPKMDGKACFRELRRINKDVKVILSSGYSEDDATGRFSGKGLSGFVQKPYTPEHLKSIVMKVCALK